MPQRKLRTTKVEKAENENSPKKRGRPKKLPGETFSVPFSRTSERAKAIYEYYLEKGAKSTAHRFNLSLGYVHLLIYKYRKYANDSRSRLRGLRLPEKDKKKIYEFYLANGYEKAAAHFGYQKVFLYNLIRNYKSKIRGGKK